MGDSRLDMLSSGSGDNGDGYPKYPGYSGYIAGKGDKKRRPFLKFLIAFLVIAGVAVGGYFLVQKLDAWFNGPEDYQGFGNGAVVIKVNPGDNGATIAQTLADADVVASTQAFYRLSLTDARAQSIQPGSYQLRMQMSASAALGALVDPSTRMQDRVTIPEGARVGQVVELIAKNTKIPEEDVEKVLDNPENIGLPAQAKGNAEGYLFPETYFVEPDTTAEELLSKMVAQTMKVATSLDIGTRARALGLSGIELLTVASILEHEGKHDEDFPKIARVIYNRIDDGMPLQMDSTVHFVSKREGDVWTTEKERDDPSLYNTYKNKGLPPGPIGSPGKKTMEAALNPTPGTWLYFVTVDIKTGETKFNTTYAEHVADCKEAFGAGAGC